MSERKLTQEQIDELFGAASAGGFEAVDDMVTKDKDSGYTDYDFDRPDKFNTENLKSLRTILSAFAKNFSQLLEASIKLPIQIVINQEIEQIPYATEYVEKLPKNSYVFCVTDLGRKDLGKIILEFDLNLVIPIHKKMLGAKQAEIENNRKTLSEIEQISLRQCVRKWLYPTLEESFKNVVELNLDLTNIETDAQYAKIATATDMVALVSFDVYIGNKQSTIRMCLPYMSIEPIIKKLTTENIYDFKMGEYDSKQTEYIKHHLNLVKKRVDVELGTSQITLKELLQFSEGDVMILDKKVDEDLVGYIENIPKFACRMGKKENKTAVKITGFAEKVGGETRE